MDIFGVAKNHPTRSTLGSGRGLWKPWTLEAINPNVGEAAYYTANFVHINTEILNTRETFMVLLCKPVKTLYLSC